MQHEARRNRLGAVKPDLGTSARHDRIHASHRHRVAAAWGTWTSANPSYSRRWRRRRADFPL